MAHRNAACPGGADNELIYISARRQLALYKKRKLSPVEVLESQIKRTAEVNPKINAVTFSHWRGARTAAKNSENRYLKGEPLPLDGVTVAIKDQFDKIGWKITAGSKLVNTVSKSNHPLVEKLIRAGAVLHMQTTAPEFYLVPVTWSDRWGITRNPWNLEVSPGGSSGGSAAAVAAGMATLAIGSDMGGSIRIPASLCGLYGYHPPYGRNSGTISDALLIHASSGPLARSFSDLMLLQNILVGPIEGAPSIRPVFRLPSRYPSIKGWKIAVSLDQSWAQVDPEVRAHTQSALSVLRKADAVVDEVDLDLRMNAADIRQAIEMALFTTSVGGELAEMKNRQTKMTTYGRRFVKFALGMTPRQAKEASEVTAKGPQGD
jgi:amidase